MQSQLEIAKLEKEAATKRELMQYEFDLNAKKQTIQMVKPDLIEDFVEVYTMLTLYLEIQEI